ncbi:MAG: hypothetical protein H0T59_08315 [Chloroflexi bacterium]|nr:hypothetical protein [Chloroflexota bacterium]
MNGPSGYLTLRDDPTAYGRSAETPRIRLVLGQPPMRPNLDRLAAAYHATAWVLGREAAGLLPLDGLTGGAFRIPWSRQATSIGRALQAVEPSLARDGRVVQLVDGGPEATIAAVLGGAAAGYRLLGVRLTDADDGSKAVVEQLPPGGILPPGPRTRANVGLDPVPGGAGDPDLVPSSRLFAPPERFDQRPFSAVDSARAVADIAVETLRARGEPATYQRLIAEILVGLDKAGHLRRLAAAANGEAPKANGDAAKANGEAAASDAEPNGDPEGAPNGTLPTEPVEHLAALIRDELARSTQRRLVEIEPGRWWLADAADIARAELPLADRVEWAVFSLLSTAGPITESAFFERIGSMFSGHDLPDEGLVRACLASYRSPASTADRVVTSDDLLRRSQDHTGILHAIAEGGHQLGMRVWIGRQEQTRRVGAGLLGDVLDDSERRASLAGISRATEDLAAVDGIWYTRGKVAFLFEVEWTAMLAEPLLRRHARITPDPSLIRFLVIAPERTELVRYKIDRSPLLRAALDAGTWHIIKSSHIRAFLARDPLDLADLEPYLGLDPTIERSDLQMPLFGSAAEPA